MKRYGSIATIVAIAWSGMVVRAHAATVDDLIARIQALTKQVDELNRKLETSPSTGAQAFSKDLKIGSKDIIEVKKLQQLLVRKGYLRPGLVTGSFGNATRASLRRLQMRLGVPPTGVLDRATRQRIGEMTTARLTGTSATTMVGGATTTVVVAIKATATTTVASQSARSGAGASSNGYAIDPRPTYAASEAERLTFDAINADRQQNGLAPLLWDDSIAAVARAHSVDQTGDNVQTTKPDGACAYPYIRHEGFVNGFKVGGRLDASGIPFRIAGENIIIFPLTKDLVYRATDPAPPCKQFSDLEAPPGETPEIAKTRVENAIKDRLAAMAGQPALNWVNKKWKSSAELASEASASWMNSPGHRHNILTPEFQWSGIGIAFVNEYVIMTQVFVQRP